ncbi:Recombination endonuclease VII [uncultured Caudovirales phage]|uniref:Recombination endonuclease VII n=1 Tax=uncultured Caudovirales phage TaxID=2100421 RepID=A0A6J5L7R6_9CAUD|nr:Recombination endonuclease VII [uncultured Caudovirales phage]
MKTCTKCGIEKSMSDFGSHSERKDKKQSACKKCCAEATKLWREKNPDAGRALKYKNKYGISILEFDAMFENQKGICAICNQKFKSSVTTCIDHNHETGKVRGLLCHWCNTGMGLFKDSIQTLENAVQYLKYHSPKE